MRNPLIPVPEKGRYVSFEGIEGSGKTYYLNELNRKHPNKFYPITEFSNEGFGAKIIEVLSHESDEFFRHGYPASEALFFFSMKLFEFDKSILPLLREGQIVIEDRSVDTNCLYAAILLQEKYGEREMYNYYEHLLDIRKELAVIPERTICFIPDFDKALKRTQRRDRRNYNESELSFLVKIYSGYEEISEKNKNRISIVYPDRYPTNEVIRQLESILGFE